MTRPLLVRDTEDPLRAAAPRSRAVLRRGLLVRRRSRGRGDRWRGRRHRSGRAGDRAARVGGCGNAVRVGTVAARGRVVGRCRSTRVGARGAVDGGRGRRVGRCRRGVRGRGDRGVGRGRGRVGRRRRGSGCVGRRRRVGRARLLEQAGDLVAGARGEGGAREEDRGQREADGEAPRREAAAPLRCDVVVELVLRGERVGPRLVAGLRLDGGAVAAEGGDDVAHEREGEEADEEPPGSMRFPFHDGLAPIPLGQAPRVRRGGGRG